MAEILVVKEMVTAASHIPWQSNDDWAELLLSVQHLCDSLGGHNTSARTLVRQIASAYRQIEAVMEPLCRATCAICREICCLKATVWYDQRDMLFQTLAGYRLPLRQIGRRPDNSCHNLGPAGCMLPRSKRPFICTWYICATQKGVLVQLARPLPPLIAGIQENRKRLEKLCVEAVCS